MKKHAARGVRAGFEGEEACVRGVTATRYSPDSCYCSASGVMLQRCASSPGKADGRGESHLHLRKDNESFMSTRMRCGVVRFPCMRMFGKYFLTDRDIGD